MTKKSIHNWLTDNVTILAVAVLVLFACGAIVVKNYYSSIVESRIHQAESDARKLLYGFTIHDQDIYSQTYKILQKELSDAFDPQKAYQVCKDMSKASPYIEYVYIEYAPDAFKGIHAFCPCYQVSTGKFSNLADTTITHCDYLKDDEIFVNTLKSEGDDAISVSDINPLLNIRHTRVVGYINNKAISSFVFNIVLKPEYQTDMCDAIKTWSRKTDNVLVFSTKDGSIWHNTFKEYPVNAYTYIKNSLSSKDISKVMNVMKSTKDTVVIVASESNSYLTVLHDEDFETGMLIERGYKPLSSRMTSLIAIIATSIVAILLIVIISYLLARKAIRNQKEIQNRRAEIDMAANIQLSMIPVRQVDMQQLRIDSCIVPARNVGGDLFYYFHRNNYLYFCIGDVSGKGLPASLFMSKTLSLFACIARYAFRADDIAEQLNTELCQDNVNSMFVTMFIGILNLKTGEFQYCNAGHDEPIYWNGLDTVKPRYLTTSDNIPLGVDAQEKYTQGTGFLKAGSKLFLYTDGVTEAKRKDLEMYGEERLLDCLTRLRLGHGPMCDSVLADVRAFVNGNEQSDDITMLAIDIKHINRTIVLKNELTELKRLPEFFDNIAKVLIYSPEELIQIRVAIDEVITNCVRYAYPDQKDKDVSLRVYTANGKLIFVITDEGIPFNPLTYEGQTAEDILDMDIEDIQIGGMGIPLMKKTFDSLDYQRDQDKNILTLKKNLNNNSHEN